MTRHVLFCNVIASAYWDAPNQIEFGWWPDRGHWLTREVHKVFVFLLVILEVSTISTLHDAADLAYMIDYPEYLVLPDMWRGISCT